MAASGKEVVSSIRGHGKGITGCLPGKTSPWPELNRTPARLIQIPLSLSPSAVKSPELRTLYSEQVQPMLELLRRMEQVKREEDRRDIHLFSLEQLQEALAEVEERRDSCVPRTKRHAKLEGKIVKLERKIALQEPKLEKAEEAITAAQEALAVVQAKQSLTPLGKPVSIPKAKVRAVQNKLVLMGLW
jgi:predicted ribosome quality control (RQC) complex YloA/Tae2 family protein